MNQDLEHLRLLSIFHYVVAGIGALCSCFPVIHLGIGLVLIFAPEGLNHERHAIQDPAMDRIGGLIFVVVAAMMILAGWALSFCVFLAGRYLAGRRRYTFCLVIAAIVCMFFPFGTALGVFTIIVLIRPSVKAMFEQQTGEPLSP
jgi:hypothetical protein